jgi:hypothetical protein
MKPKVCSKCKIEKPHDAFYQDKAKARGIRSKCRQCCSAETQEWRIKNRSHYNNYVAMWRAKNPARQHATEIKRNYGLSIEQYNAMLAAQNCQCVICGKQHDPSVKRGRLYVDHCHKTGKVRALLCGGCNSMLGHANDETTILLKAVDYLNSF